MSKHAKAIASVDHTLLETAIGHVFTQKELLERALTHPSFSADHSQRVPHYERLEFLGDAVLQLVISEMIFLRFHHEKEGDLAKRRAALVCGETLAEVALSLPIAKYLRIGKSEEASQGRSNPANLENALEAIIAAIYMDGGMTPARALIERLFTPIMEEKKAPPKDAKTTLQEWAQGRGLPLPVYTVVERSGAAHSPVFTVEVQVSGQPPMQASAQNKKFAERQAAALLCDHLGIER